MRKTLIIDLFLGFALRFFESQDNERAADYVRRGVFLKKNRQDVDAHMQAVAAYMLGEGELDFDDLKDRVNSEVDELLARGDQLESDGGNAPDTVDHPGGVGGEVEIPEPGAGGGIGGGTVNPDSPTDGPPRDSAEIATP